ncbi:unnamed protein product [Candidatus Protochlamydia amoebophila UWE25]|uniref:PpiC domain-containing protein n=2 Tax=Candidatus Protochlamydia amoebophila TaxID=362787 RepID=Q6ME79_PARUW|nr:unnamed protein product [Candidatus Protochlamydia amoebophila UWE25]
MTVSINIYPLTYKILFLVMKKTIFIASLSFFLTFYALEAIKSDDFLSSSRTEESKIFINNRILARINGKPISAYDLVKKMDVTFYKQFPQYLSSTEARYQYYQFSWKYALEDLINKELILADAQESKVEVTSGDVRQEMELMFGPNIIASLDKIGLSFEEASKIVQGDILLKRMIGARVNGKAIRQVTPSRVRKSYEDFIKDPANIRLTIWNYKVLTIKDRNLKKSEEIAQAAYQLLRKGFSIEEVPAKLKEGKLLGRKGKVTVSKVIHNNEKELSKSYQQILNPLDTGMYSLPFENKSRVEHTTVYRILFVQEKIPGGYPSFKEMEPVLKERLLNQVADEETDLYLKKLREHFYVRDKDLEAMVPADYQPFVLK